MFRPMPHLTAFVCSCLRKDRSPAVSAAFGELVARETSGTMPITHQNAPKSGLFCGVLNYLGVFCDIYGT